jgi:outer membrane murein-binding lipoprotein Lpp
VSKLTREKKELEGELEQVKKTEEDRLALKKKINAAQSETSSAKREHERVNQALLLA